METVVLSKSERNKEKRKQWYINNRDAILASRNTPEYKKRISDYFQKRNEEICHIFP